MEDGAFTQESAAYAPKLAAWCVKVLKLSVLLGLAVNLLQVIAMAAPSDKEVVVRRKGIGAFVSEEDIDIGGDLAVSAAGKFVWKAGRLYMDTDEDWWALKDRGSGIYCTMEPDSRDGEEDAKSPCITNFGTLGAPQGKTAIDNDNGIRTTDIDLSGEVYICGDEHVIINFYPIYQTADGRIYLTRGNSMGMSGADGASVTHTLTRDKTETIGGKSERVKVKVAITVVARATPTKFTVAHMDENDNLLKLRCQDPLPRRKRR